jgi:hypothetical protein
MTLFGFLFVCFGAPVLLILAGLAWLWLGQKLFGFIFSGC